MPRVRAWQADECHLRHPVGVLLLLARLAAVSGSLVPWTEGKPGYLKWIRGSIGAQIRA